MKNNKTIDNFSALERELDWFQMALDVRFQGYFNPNDESVDLPQPPNLEKDESNYAQVVRQYGFGINERLVFCLALAPHLRPQILDLFFTTNKQINRPFTEFGGKRGQNHAGFLPTGETAAFLVAPDDISDRIEVGKMFSPEHAFAVEHMLYLDETNPKEPFLSGRLMINEAFLSSVTPGKNSLPESTDLFPGKLISTKMEWKDLVVHPSVMEELMEIKSWIENERQLMEDPVFNKQVKPGFRSLFYGQPGTGKSLAASLLGKTGGLDVYRIDLSYFVSKYIGETEKNLSKIFNFAERQNYILFFDEADALFGKRTQSNSSNDRYANQEVSYLLQRIEDFSGILILASNLKPNMDEAFSRRFQSIIHFPMPDADQRLRLWQNLFRGRIKPAQDVELETLAKDYELSGGSMINILRRSTLKAIKSNQQEISYKDIIQSIRNEYQKDSKTI